MWTELCVKCHRRYSSRYLMSQNLRKSLPSTEELRKVCDAAENRSKLKKLSDVRGKQYHKTRPKRGNENHLDTDGEEDEIQATVEDVGEVSQSSAFYIHEYAQLCALLRDHPDCRAASINPGKIFLARLDAKLPRDHLCTTVMETF